jgi:(p)ppGpp synthase/HD superfamily hydrolase
MDLIFEAFNFATKAHKNQTRKKDADPEVPYIAHSAAVAVILSRADADQITIAAGILHDVVEDTDVSIKDVEEKFGKEVAGIVSDVTEFDKNLSWNVRKEQAIKHVKNMNEKSLLVKTADKIHNLYSLIEAYEKHGAKTFDVFKAPADEMLEMDKKLYESLIEKWPDNPLLIQLKPLIDKFEEINKET